MRAARSAGSGRRTRRPARRGGDPGLSAQEFFPGLLARVEAPEHLTEPAPTRELSVARLKRALPDPVRRIELHELVDGEAVRVVERLSDGDRYPPGGPASTAGVPEAAGAVVR
ncbi:hypothetical protein [Streptomyces leeuwenhoekii]|uniref:hypothetical protein n=1 Tax=Streptomyces leeuwenhoekii TaxID=1437453 RepID=UPI000A81DA73|nr:hypothetical protein [Streptomyces leeuwenhoekii]